MLDLRKQNDAASSQIDHGEKKEITTANRKIILSFFTLIIKSLAVRVDGKCSANSFMSMAATLL